MMPKSTVPVIVAALAGFALFAKPSPVDTAGSEFAAFFTLHDRLHPADIEKREPHRVYVRKTFWDDDERKLRVDAGSTRGKGELIIIDGLPDSDWLSAFAIAGDDGVVFSLSVPQGEPAPCRVIVRTASEHTVAVVQNAPARCTGPDESTPWLLASL